MCNISLIERKRELRMYRNLHIHHFLPSLLAQQYNSTGKLSHVHDVPEGVNGGRLLTLAFNIDTDHKPNVFYNQSIA